MPIQHLIPDDALEVPEKWRNHPCHYFTPLIMAVEAHFFDQTTIGMTLVNIMRGKATKDDLDLALLGLSIAKPSLLRDPDHLRWCQRLCLKLGRDDLLDRIQMSVNRDDGKLL